MCGPGLQYGGISLGRRQEWDEIQPAPFPCHDSPASWSYWGMWIRRPFLHFVHNYNQGTWDSLRDTHAVCLYMYHTLNFHSGVIIPALRFILGLVHMITRILSLHYCDILSMITWALIYFAAGTKSVSHFEIVLHVSCPCSLSHSRKLSANYFKEFHVCTLASSPPNA